MLGWLGVLAVVGARDRPARSSAAGLRPPPRGPPGRGEVPRTRHRPDRRRRGRGGRRVPRGAPSGYLQSAVIRQVLEPSAGGTTGPRPATPSWKLDPRQARPRSGRLAPACSRPPSACWSSRRTGITRSPPGSSPRTRASVDRATAPTVKPSSPATPRSNAALRLLVVARFNGPVPADASAGRRRRFGRVGREADGQGPGRPDLRRPDRVASAPTWPIKRPVRPKASSETYKVKVFEYPEVRRADAKLVFPELHRRSRPRSSRTSATSRPSRGPS